MTSVFLSLGSNIEPAKNIPAALELLKRKLQVLKVSPVYETDPVGPAGLQKFWNLAVAIGNPPGRKELILQLREIESALERKRESGNRFTPRTIDIDILPQQDYQQYAFIMVPLSDIAPESRAPETGKTHLQLAQELTEEARQSIRKIQELY